MLICAEGTMLVSKRNQTEICLKYELYVLPSSHGSNLVDRSQLLLTSRLIQESRLVLRHCRKHKGLTRPFTPDQTALQRWQPPGSVHLHSADITESYISQKPHVVKKISFLPRHRTSCEH